MISKYKNAQLVYIDGKVPAKIRRVIKNEQSFEYEIRDSGEVLPEDRLTLLKN